MTTNPTISIAIIGATGAVGRCMLHELTASPFYSSFRIQLGLFASAKSQGLSLQANGVQEKVQAFSVAALRGYDYALMSAGGEFSRTYAESLTEMGVVVIDNSSAFRLHEHSPLIVPEVNAHCLDLTPSSSSSHSAPSRRGIIIANPNCSTIQLMVAVAPLEWAFGLKTIITSTYQSVSGSGQNGIEELSSQCSNLRSYDPATLKNIERNTCSTYSAPIAFNLLAAIGPESPHGDTLEEEKMMAESRKILQRSDLQVMATAVRVPVFYGHGQTVVCELKEPVTRSQALEVLEHAPGVVCTDDVCTASPRYVQGSTNTYVSRIRLGTPITSERSSSQHSSWLQMWNVADNLLKGAATNAVQILEQCLRQRKNIRQ